MSEWIDENVAGDLFVSSGAPLVTLSGHTPLDGALAAEIADVPGVAHVTGVRMPRVRWRDTRILLLALDLEEYRPFAKVSVRGEAPRDALLARAAAGTACLVSDNFPLLHGVGTGDDLDLALGDGAVRLRVVGTFPDYDWPRGTVMLDRSLLVAAGDARVDQFSVKLAPGADAAAAARAIEDRVGEGRELVVHGAATIRDAAKRLLDDFFALGYAQAAAALAVAFLAVFNSLWIAVVTRRRELGLLRAAGATRGQLVASLVLQAAATGAIGAALGVAGGFAVEWLALRRILVEDTGWTVRFVLPWGAAGAAVVFATAVSALAGLVPARAAARTEIRDAVGWE